MMPTSFRASATTAMNLFFFRSAIAEAHSTIGSLGRVRKAVHAACISSQRTVALPALVKPVLRWVSELECSPGVSPT